MLSLNLFFLPCAHKPIEATTPRFDWKIRGEKKLNNRCLHATAVVGLEEEVYSERNQLRGKNQLASRGTEATCSQDPVEKAKTCSV